MPDGAAVPRTAEIASELRAAWADDLGGAVERARALGIDGPGLTEANLAWGVAWLIESSSRKANPITEVLGGGGGLAELRKRYTAALSGSGRASSPLAELATSIACEQVLGWQDLSLDQPPGEDALTRWQEASRNARACVYEEHHRRVVAGCARFADGDEAEDLAAEGWAQVTASYWGPRSRSRWCGFSRISTLVMTSCKFIAYRRRKRVNEHAWSDVDSIAQSFFADPTSGDELRRAYAICRDALPGRQRLGIELWCQFGMAKGRIADALGCSPQNVTALLDRAKVSVRDCLTKKGFGPGGGGND
ncbi:MAG: sigma-70 family RNA polymerase sigma factor [Planctomycetota bacterium]